MNILITTSAHQHIVEEAPSATHEQHLNAALHAMLVMHHEQSTHHKNGEAFRECISNLVAAYEIALLYEASKSHA